MNRHRLQALRRRRRAQSARLTRLLPLGRLALALGVVAVASGCAEEPLFPLTGVLTGAVCDGGGATVVLRVGNRQAAARTGDDGLFTFINVAPGDGELVVDRGDGRGRERHAVTILAEGETTFVDSTCENVVDADDEACAVVAVASASYEPAPVDIIVVVDSSGSMRDDNAAVQATLNRFATSVGDAGIDHRVVLIGRLDVPPPLGGSERLRDIATDVESDEPLERIIATRPQWADFVRSDAEKHFVVVTDDQSDVSAAAFSTAVASWEGFDGWTLHAVYAYGEDHNQGCSSGEAWGSVYETLVEESGGTRAPVCGADYDVVFSAVKDAVARPSLPCRLEVPPLPSGGAVTGGAVVLEHGDATETWSVGDDAACSDGWFLDDGAVVACADTCAALGAQDGMLTATFQCAGE